MTTRHDPRLATCTHCLQTVPILRMLADGVTAILPDHDLKDRPLLCPGRRDQVQIELLAAVMTAFKSMRGVATCPACGLVVPLLDDADTGTLVLAPHTLGGFDVCSQSHPAIDHVAQTARMFDRMPRELLFGLVAKVFGLDAKAVYPIGADTRMLIDATCDVLRDPDHDVLFIAQPAALALRLAKTLRCWLCKLGYDQISVAGSEHEITSFAAPTLGRTIIAYQLHDPVRRINP